MDYLQAGESTYTTERLKLSDLSLDEQAEVVRVIVSKYRRLKEHKSAIEMSWRKVQKTVNIPLSNLNLSMSAKTNIAPLHVGVLNTILGHFWNKSISTATRLFDIIGLDQNSQQQAPLYKANLMDMLNRDRFQSRMNEIIEKDAIPKGVAIVKIEYKEQVEEKSVPIHLLKQINMDSVKEMEVTDDGSMVRYRKKVYDGPTIRRVDPYDFIFDSKDDFDVAFKVERRLRRYSDLLEATDDQGHAIYENLNDLEAKESFPDDGPTMENNALSGRGNSVDDSENAYDSDGRIEVLEFWGDLKVKFGEKTVILKNYQLAIAAREHLIQFEPNTLMFNPFHKWEYRKTGDGWGESILLATLDMVEKSAEQISLGCEAAKLAINPPIIAPEGMFTQTQINLQPGLLIKYKSDQWTANTPPQPLKLNPNAPFEYIQYFETTMEAVTGATRQLSGSTTSEDKEQTATEYQGQASMGSLLLDRFVDLFDNEFKLPVIEKFAQLLGYFNPQERNVLSKSSMGASKLERIPTSAYFGDYVFMLEDAKSEVERKGLVREEFGFVLQLFQSPVLGPQLDQVNIIKSMFTRLGYGDPDSLFKSEDQLQQDQQGMGGGQPQAGVMPPNPMALRQQNRAEAEIMPTWNDAITGTGVAGGF